VRAFTRQPNAALVVADDGSSDGTLGEGFRTPAANERRAVTGRRPEASQERTRG
jgi:hypothetical protein